MTGRVLALPIGAALLLGAGVYLYIQVRATPATPVSAPRETAAAPKHERHEAATVPAPAETPDDSPKPERVKRLPDPEERATGAGKTPLADEPVATPPPSGTPGIDAKLESVMQQANRAYDRGDLDEAKMIATRVLSALPNNARMLRIVVSAACIDGDAANAQANFAKLPQGDQEQMRTRCARYGITL